MRPPSYYASLASSNSRTSGGGGVGGSRSSSELRSSLAAPSSSTYVTRTHLPYVSQSVLMAHCITGPGSTTRPYSSASSTSSSYLSGAPRPKSLKRYTPSATGLSSSSYLSSSNLSLGKSSYTPSLTSSRGSYYSSGSSASSYRPTTTTSNYTSSYYKPIRLRERPLLAQIQPAAPSRTPAAPSSRLPSRKEAASGASDEGKWSADVGRNISRNKYLIKFRELDKRAPAEPIQLRNRQAEVEPAAAGGERQQLAPVAKTEERPKEAAKKETPPPAPRKQQPPPPPPEVAADDKAPAAEPTAPSKPKVKRLVKPKVAAAAAKPSVEPDRKVLAPKQELEPPKEPPKERQPEPEVAPAATQAASDTTSGGGGGSKRIRFRPYSLDDFNLLSVLGHGGWGFVMLAELKEHDACFAVKCIKKITIVEDDDFDSIMIERKVLSLGNLHPFICKLFCTFETPGYLFFVMEFCAGGDLMFHVQREGKFTEARCRFYAAEIICAIRFLHNRHIIYRDLKLDNILLDSRGHVRLVDFGMCQCRTYREEMLPSNFCGTPEYISPEIIKGVPYNHSVDWWSFGVLLYEMAVGKMPFRGSDENELLWNVCYEQIHYPMFLTKELAHLLQCLLEREPSLRMGMATCKAGDIYNQAWFRGLDWQAVEELRVEPPFVPEVSSKRDVQNFDPDFTEAACELSPVDEATLGRIDQNQFQKFPYTNPDIFIFDAS